jgi:hexosaminidase
MEQMLETMSGTADPAPLRVLASVVEPPKIYEREKLREYTTRSPLNRLVDAVPPESDTARVFKVICTRIAAGSATPEDIQQAHDWLVLWRDNDARLQPTLAKSEITAELAPVSASLRQVAEIGLRTLDALSRHEALTGDEQRQGLEAVKAAEKPQAVLLLMAAPSVELLLKSARVN